MTAKERKERLLTDPAVSYWLKNALHTLEERDPCDVLNDLETLTIYFNAKIDDIMGIKE